MVRLISSWTPSRVCTKRRPPPCVFVVASSEVNPQRKLVVPVEGLRAHDRVALRDAAWPPLRTGAALPSRSRKASCPGCTLGRHSIDRESHARDVREERVDGNAVEGRFGL